MGAVGRADAGLRIYNRLFSTSSPTFAADSDLLEVEALALGAEIMRAAPALFCADGVWFFCSDAVSVGAALTSNHKLWTKLRLIEAGVPVPAGVMYDASHEVPPDLAGPLVVKPVDSTGANGVAINLTRRSTEFHMAFHRARGLTKAGVLVEEYVPGPKYRVLVLAGRVIGVTRTLENAAGIASVHAGGAGRVEASRTAPADLVEVAVNAAAAIPGLHLAGVDVIDGPDGPRVLEVNATPRIWGHHNPEEGEAVNVAAEIVRHYLRG